MKYLVYTFFLFVLISEPTHISQGQNKPTAKPLPLTNPLNKVLANTDSLLVKAKALPEQPPPVKEKIVTKWRTVYRTKIKEVVDTIYINQPENDTLFVPEKCLDTIYIDRPILVKRKGLLRRIF